MDGIDLATTITLTTSSVCSACKHVLQSASSKQRILHHKERYARCSWREMWLQLDVRRIFHSHILIGPYEKALEGAFVSIALFGINSAAVAFGLLSFKESKNFVSMTWTPCALKILISYKSLLHILLRYIAQQCKYDIDLGYFCWVQYWRGYLERLVLGQAQLCHCTSHSADSASADIRAGVCALHWPASRFALSRCNSHAICLWHDRWSVETCCAKCETLICCQYYLPGPLQWKGCITFSRTSQPANQWIRSTHVFKCLFDISLFYPKHTCFKTALCAEKHAAYIMLGTSMTNFHWNGLQ